MDLRSHYIRQTAMSRGILKNHLLKDLSDKEAFHVPKPGIPPIVWHVGHIAVTESAALLGMGKGEWDALPRHWLDQFAMGSRQPQDPRMFPRLSALMPEIDRLAEACIACARSLAEDELKQPLPHWKDGYLPIFMRSWAGCLTGLPVHFGHHTGQISLLRRLQEKQGFA